MKQRKFKIDTKLREVFLVLGNSTFSILELRDKFEAVHGDDLFDSSSELRKWIYRRMISLVKKGYLIKQNSNDKTPTIYHLSEQFLMELGSSLHDSNLKQFTDFAIEHSETDPFNSLRLRLNQYKVDMLSCTGECKEYQQLAADYPYLKDLIDPMFRDARERSSELIGQLKAINNLMKQSGLSE